jgi:hypothetical protein
VKWLVPSFIPAKALVSFQGRAKSGKSTLVFHMLKALVDGSEFLGEKLEKTGVVYLSEQPRSVFKQQLQEAGVNVESENLTVLTVEDNHGLGWDKTFELAMLQLKATNSKLLIVDSWGRFADFRRDEDEMSPAPTQRRITTIRKLMAETDASVFIVHHVSKATNRGLIDSGMGSSALAQQVDLALSLSGEPPGKEIQSNRLLNSNCRAIQGKGRYSEGITEPFALELKDGEFIRSQFKENEGDPDLARTFLLDCLRDTVPHASSDLQERAARLGVSRNALFKMKRGLGVQAFKRGKKWFWQLPAEILS